jgi:hypothetical protein
MPALMRALTLAALSVPLALLAAWSMAAVLATVRAPTLWPSYPFVVLESALYLGVGVPIYLAVRRSRRVTLPTVGVAGFTIGAVAPAVLRWPGDPQETAYRGTGTATGYSSLTPERQLRTGG